MIACSLHALHFDWGTQFRCDIRLFMLGVVHEGELCGSTFIKLMLTCNNCNNMPNKFTHCRTFTHCLMIIFHRHAYEDSPIHAIFLVSVSIMQV